jgi:hypothetical protein
VKTIWKFPLRVTDVQTVRMPVGAVLLTVQIQHAMPTIWALVEDANPDEDVTVRIYGTGHTVMANLEYHRYLGTVQHLGLVWHVFVSRGTVGV